MIRDFLARNFLAHTVTFRHFMAGNFLAGDFLGWIHCTTLGIRTNHEISIRKCTSGISEETRAVQTTIAYAIAKKHIACSYHIVPLVVARH